MQVAVVGCGPAGLLAALAVREAGHDPYIVSKKVKSRMFGAMFLHRAITGITPQEPEFNVYLNKVGSKEGYARNVYGDPSAEVSWERLPDVIPAWDIVKAYDKLWELFEADIRDVTMATSELEALSANFEGRVINTVPRHNFCYTPQHHYFNFLPINILHGVFPDPIEDSIMYYNGANIIENGKEGPDWYRFSVIQHYAAWEYRDVPGWDAIASKDYSLSQGIKVAGTNCTCWDEILHVGRFGKWQKGVLTHHAYEEAKDYADAL